MKRRRVRYSLILLFPLLLLAVMPEASGYWRCDAPDCPSVPWYALAPSRCCCDVRADHPCPHGGKGLIQVAPEWSAPGICGCVAVAAPDSHRVMGAPTSAMAGGIFVAVLPSPAVLISPGEQRISRIDPHHSAPATGTRAAQGCRAPPAA